MQEQHSNVLSKYWTKEILERCTPRELLIIVARYGPEAVAKRMGYQDIEEFARARQAKQS